MTEHIKKKLSDEIQTLEHELQHELPKVLKKAVAMGDLSENAEYHMAKQRQEFVHNWIVQRISAFSQRILIHTWELCLQRRNFLNDILKWEKKIKSRLCFLVVTIK